MTIPTVAVVIPTHNRWPIVRRAVASVLAQSHPNTECVVVDDASTDCTPQLLRQEFGGRVKVIELPQNLEKSAARNVGIRAATADFISMLDSDDELTKHSVEDRLAVFREDPSFDGVSYGLTCLDDEDQEIRWASRPQPEGDVLLQYLRRPFLHNNGFLLSRAQLEQHGMYDERLTHREDKTLLIRLAARLEFRCCNAYVTRIHRVPGSAQQDYQKALRQGLLVLECLRADSTVRKRLGTNFFELERAEHWEYLRCLYLAGKYPEYRQVCAASWRFFTGRKKMQWTILRRWMASCFLQQLKSPGR